MTTSGQFEISLMLINPGNWVFIHLFLFEELLSCLINSIDLPVDSKTKTTMTHGSEYFLSLLGIVYLSFLTGYFVFSLERVNDVFGCLEEIFIDLTLRI